MYGVSATDGGYTTTSNRNFSTPATSSWQVLSYPVTIRKAEEEEQIATDLEEILFYAPDEEEPLVGYSPRPSVEQCLDCIKIVKTPLIMNRTALAGVWTYIQGSRIIQIPIRGPSVSNKIIGLHNKSSLL